MIHREAPRTQRLKNSNFELFLGELCVSVVKIVQESKFRILINHCEEKTRRENDSPRRR